jgi:hypothetical protein
LQGFGGAVMDKSHTSRGYNASMAPTPIPVALARPR